MPITPTDLQDLAARIERLEAMEKLINHYTRSWNGYPEPRSKETPMECLTRVFEDYHATVRVFSAVMPAYGKQRPAWLALQGKEPDAMHAMLETWLVCKHCRRDRYEHNGGKCLFEPTEFMLNVNEIPE